MVDTGLVEFSQVDNEWADEIFLNLVSRQKNLFAFDLRVSFDFLIQVLC